MFKIVMDHIVLINDLSEDIPDIQLITLREELSSTPPESGDFSGLMVSSSSLGMGELC